MKVTQLKRIGNLVIFSRSGKNRTYLIGTEQRLRRIEQLVGGLLISNNAHATHGDSFENFRLIVTKNIQQA